jgi:hypothetical protein
VPADRARVSYFLRWFFWSGITHAIMDADGAAPAGRAMAGVPLYLVRRLVSASAGVLTALVTGRRTAALTRAIDVAFVAGYAFERWGFVTRAGRAPAPAGEVA